VRMAMELGSKLRTEAGTLMSACIEYIVSIVGERRSRMGLARCSSNL